MKTMPIFKNVQISIQEIMFYGYYITLLILKGLGYADGYIYKFGLLIAALFILGKLVVTAYTKVEWIAVGGLLSLAVINRLKTGLDSSWIVLSVLVMMKGISIRRAMKIGAIIWPTCFIIQILTHLLGIRSFDFVVHNKFGLGYVFRWAMGYVHPNVLQISYNVVVFYLVYVYFSESTKLLFRSFFFSSVGAIYIFLYSLSVTGIVMFAAFWLFVAVLMIDRHHNLSWAHRGLKYLIIVLLPIEAGTSILFPLILKGTAFDFIEKLMTHRPSLTRFFFTNYGISLLGQNPKGLSHIYTLDCSYANLLFHGGLVLFVLLFVSYFLLIQYELNRLERLGSIESVLELAITLACLLGAMSEPFAFNTSFKNVSLLFLGSFLFKPHEEKNEYYIFNRENCLEKITFEVPIVMELAGSIEAKKVMGRVRITASIIGVLCALTCVLLYIQQAKVIQTYYVCRINTDAGEEQKESEYLTYEDVRILQNDSSVRIVNYKNPETQMVKFTGHIGEIEYMRCLLSVGLWSYVFGCLGIFVIAAVKRLFL